MTQLARLSDYEARADEAVKDVNKGLERFASVLKEIKDLGLYRGQHETFEEYCRERWGRSLRTVQRALKAHDTRKKLLAAAPEPEKEAIQKASTAAILKTATTSEQREEIAVLRGAIAAEHNSEMAALAEAAKSKLQSIDHLVIGRKQPAATKLSDFYGSNEPVKVIGVDPWIPGADTTVFARDREADGQIAQRVLLVFLEKQPEEHRDYLRWVAQEIAK